MKIVLQQRDTGLYFKDIESWVAKSSEAMDFLSSSVAIEFCVANKLAGVQVVLKFQDQPYEIVLPMMPEGLRAPKQP
jgi:hypothetical protein